MPDKVSGFVKRWVKFWIEQFSLREWVLEITEVDAERIALPDVEGTAVAYIDIKYDELKAGIGIASANDPDEVTNSLLHETIHLALADAYAAFNSACDELSPSAKDQAATAFRSGMERGTVRLQRGIWDLRCRWVKALGENESAECEIERLNGIINKQEGGEQDT